MIKISHFIFLLCLMFLLNTRTTFAQYNDAGTWISINAEKKITPVFSFTLSEEGRFNENFCELGTFFTDAGLSYKVNKLIKVSLNYRFTNKRKIDDSYSVRHRYYVDLSIRKKFKPIILSFRTRFQSQYTDMFSSSTGLMPSYYSRNKLTLKFDLDKNYTPYISAELFSPLNNPDGGIFIDNTRYAVGIEYTFNRMHSLDIFYLIQRECNVNNPETDYIIGLGYYLNF
jgi:hypothetical protein